MEVLVALAYTLRDHHFVRVNLDGFDVLALACGLNDKAAYGLEPHPSLYARRFRVFQRVASDTRISGVKMMIVSLTDAVNHPIKLTKPSVGVVNLGECAHITA